MNLLSLPVEVLLNIARHVDTQQGLLNVIKTNQLLSSLAIPLLYRLNATGDVDGLAVTTTDEEETTADQGQNDGADEGVEEEGENWGGQQEEDGDGEDGDEEDEDENTDEQGEEESNAETEYDETDSESEAGSTGIDGDERGEDELWSLKSSAVYWAVKEAQLGTLQHAQAAGVSTDDYRLIRLAVARGCLPIVEHLLSLHPHHLISPSGSRLVEVACWNGHLKVAKRLFELGATITDDPQRVLVAALGHNFEVDTDAAGLPRELVSVLLANGAKVNAADQNNDLPIMHCLNQWTTRSLAALLENGASVNVGSDNPPLSVAISNASSQFGNRRSDPTKTIKLLVKHGADLAQCDAHGVPPLVSAAGHAPADVVKLLLAHGASAASQDTSGCTALLAAATRGEEEAVGLLLDHGAEVDHVATCGCTPLAHACEGGDADTIKLLLDRGADVTRTNAIGKTMLHLGAACRGRRPNVIKTLLKHGKELAAATGQEGIKVWLDKADPFGRTAAFYAARSGAGEILRILIEEGADVDIKDRYGATAAFAAARNGHEDATHVLLAASPASIDERDVFGRRLIDWAVESGPTSLVRLVNSYKGEPVLSAMPTWYPGPMWNDFNADKHSCDVCKRILGQAGSLYWSCPACSKLTTAGVHQVCPRCVELADAAGVPKCLEESHVQDGQRRGAKTGIGCHLTANVSRANY